MASLHQPGGSFAHCSTDSTWFAGSSAFNSEQILRRSICEGETVTDYTDKVHDVKAKSQFIGSIVFGMVVLILVAVIVFKRSFIKPFDVNEKLPGMPTNNEI